MKQSIYYSLGISAILTLFSFNSCTREIEPQNTEIDDNAPVFMAYTPIEETKTSLDADLNVLWNEGDELSIFCGSTVNRHYLLSAGAGTTSASFEKVTSSGFVAGTELDCNVAWYPYDKNTSIRMSAGKLVLDVTLPATQNYAHNSFGSGANAMVAVTTGVDDYDLGFKNVLAAIKIQLKGDATITKIELTANDSQALCGAATVTPNANGAPTIALTGEESTITLDCGAGVKLNASSPTSFIISLPPVTLSQGFTLKIFDSVGNYMEKSTNASVTLSRAELRPLKAFSYEPTGTDSHEYVDLGLPSGLLWATCNVGASAPEEYGNYYAWGETETKSDYSESTSKWYGVSNSDLLSKGVIDSNGNLTSPFDAASANWGGSWRMPTYAEENELLYNCTWEWTSQNGVNGRKVTGPNGNSIFLPAADSFNGTSLNNEGATGNYWISTTVDNSSSYAFLMQFSSKLFQTYGNNRYRGSSIRPVSNSTQPHIAPERTSLSFEWAGGSSMISVISNCEWTPISSESWLNVSCDGDKLIVSAIANEGTESRAATISLCQSKNYDILATISVSQSNKDIVHEYVDLGLPSGLLWATCNMGANSSEEYGDYYAWGETVTKSDYSESTSKWYNVSYSDLLSKGVIDSNGNLTSPFDAAAANWGGSWRMPTYAEEQELMNYCTSTWTSQNGVYGRKVTGPNGNSIFLPAAGYRNGKSLNNAGTNGHYWSSTALENNYYTYHIYFLSGYFLKGSFSRYYGQSVRPVSTLTQPYIDPEQTSLSFGASGSTKTVSVTSNCEWTPESSESWLTVSRDGDNLHVSVSVNEGTESRTATISLCQSGSDTVLASISVIQNGNNYNGHDYVDLGLPSGLLWATCNVGASAPEEYGNYYAWGETETKINYSESTSKWYYVSYNDLQSQGVIDNNGNLTSSYDAASVNWGGSWRMPTYAEENELLNICTWEWTNLNGVNGRKVTGPNGNSIFLPTAGYRFGTSLYSSGSVVGYWSSTTLDDSKYAYSMNFDSGHFYTDYDSRYYGLSVRPVSE